MTPMWRPSRRTDSAVSLRGSNFIGRLRAVLLLVFGGVKRTFVAFTRLRLRMIADERLDDGHEGARNHEKVVIENTHKLEQCVVTGYDLSGLDARDVRLRQAELARQIPLAPVAFFAQLFQPRAHFLRQTPRTQWLD